MWTPKELAPRPRKLPRGATRNPHQLAWHSTRRKMWIMEGGRRWWLVAVEEVRGRGLKAWALPGCNLKARHLPPCPLIPPYHNPLPLSLPPSGENDAPRSQRTLEDLCMRISFPWEDMGEDGMGGEGEAATPPPCHCLYLFPSPPPTLLPLPHLLSPTPPPPALPLPPAPLLHLRHHLPAPPPLRPLPPQSLQGAPEIGRRRWMRRRMRRWRS